MPLGKLVTDLVDVFTLWALGAFLVGIVGILAIVCLYAGMELAVGWLLVALARAPWRW